ncbi:MAG: hypothetical protein JNM46_06190 [Anaerolineales bacterium]|nr:hypothetical protein [Anaerolineales bacterium]
MIEKPQGELIVEILDQVHEWGRSEYIQFVKSQGRKVRVLSLAESIPPKDNFDETWLDIKEISDAVSEKIRELYPRFLYETAKSTGLLDITVLDKKVSLYWLMPISEMSVLRNPLIDKLYALFVLKEVLQKNDYQKVLLVTDDELLEIPVREICKKLNLTNIETKILKQDKPLYYRNTVSLIVSWWLQFVSSLAYWFIFNMFKIGELEKENSAYVLGLTIFPTLWSKNNKGIFENMAFGDFPVELKKHGYRLKYLAIPTMKLRNLISDIRYWKKLAHQSQISFIQSLLSFQDFLFIYFRVGWGKELSFWFQKLSNTNVHLDSIDVKHLLVREFKHEIWNLGFAQSLIVTYASANLIKKVKNISSAVCAFEAQPIEKAFSAGLKKENQSIKLIGLQTSLSGKSHLGYYFLPEQISQTHQLIPPFAPLPDYVAAYGETTYNLLMKKLGKDRVQLTGPVRYPYLKIDSQTERDKAKEKIKDRFNHNGETVLAILALPSLKEEALMILDWAFAIAKSYPQLYFLVRFHYWAILNDELKDASQLHSVTNYQVVAGDLHELLLTSQFMITGTSSVGIEAIASGCMPISYKPTRRYDFGRIQDVEEGAFLYTNQAELQKAINECITQGDVFAEKKSKWEKNLQKLCTPLDGKASSRLYNWLDTKDVFNKKVV